MYLNSIDSSACVVVSYSCKTLFDYCDRCLFFSFSCNFSTKGQIQHVRKPKRHDIFFSILNYWFTCLSSVGSSPFAKIFTLGNNIGHIIECSRFSNYCRSNCFEWKSLMKNRHSTKSNSPKTIDHSIFEVNQTLSLVTEQSGTKSNFLIPNSWWQVC